MLKEAELGRKVSKDAYERRIPALRAALLKVQHQLSEARVPVVIVVSGADGAGKSETVSRLHEWLDPRGLETNVFGLPSAEEDARPPFWPFWMTLPPKGRTGVFLGSWYTDPILHRVHRKTDQAEFSDDLDRIQAFERTLAQDGVLIVKLWLHLSRKAQKKRLLKLESDARTKWRVSPTDWKHFGLYERFAKHSEQALQRTHKLLAPWKVIEAADDQHRDLAVGRAVLLAMQKRAALLKVRTRASMTVVRTIRAKPVLNAVDLTLSLSAKEYEDKLTRLQAEASRLSRAAYDKKVSTVLVFEGWDAAGKGGAIRRLTSAIDARLYRVISVAAPNEEERAHHYMWRFWRQLPPAGRITIFDRSWYGRVLVERVEGFARDHEWRRAFQEINEFEEQLIAHGAMLAKFWLHISGDEQLLRFKQRQRIDFKRHKITDEDWRNRKQWNAYETAVNEMVARTSPKEAPWEIVSGNDKRYARIQVLETFCDRLKRALD